MATIYLHPTGGGTGDNCLILDSRERLIYPFNIGNYSEIRFGIIFSYAPVSGSNGEVTQETFTVKSPTQAMYIGYCNYNTGTLSFPGQSNGYDFIGMSSMNTFDKSMQFMVNEGGKINYYGGGEGPPPFYRNYTPFLKTCQTGYVNLSPYTTFSSSENLGINPYSGVYGETKFSSYFGMRLVLNSNTYSIQTFSDNSSSNDTSNLYLRTGVNVMPNISSAITGFFTSGDANSSDIMFKPNSIYIYNPLLQNRMRIHNILVERYA